MRGESTQDAYDVIICGTDLVQSILSSALSRAGKKVLHCDGNDWYGGFDAVLYGGGTLDLFIEQCMDVEQKQGKESVVDSDHGSEEMDYISLLPKEKYASLMLHSQTILCEDEKYSNSGTVSSEDVSEPKITHLTIHTVDDVELEHTNTSNATKNANETNNVDGFSLDINPYLLYASGDAVEGLVKSGVSDYLEFKSVEGLFVLMAEDDSSKSNSRRSNRQRNKSGDKTVNSNEITKSDKPLVSYRVPCSKADVFRSKLLSPVDKRRLMKFLQLITDYGMVMASQSYEAEVESEAVELPVSADDDVALNGDEGDDATEAKLPTSAINNGEDAIHSVNERHLNRGRALSRPQNKATASSADIESLIRCVHDGVNFSDFLRTVAKLPERLAVVVVYALALSPFGYNLNEQISDSLTQVSKYSTKDGVEDLLLHVTALGRFGSTAFLTTMYGSGELSQAFCRSGAVYGSTYMLRRPPLRVTLDKTSNRVSGVVLGGEGFEGFDDDIQEQEISCDHVIFPSTMVESSFLHNTVRTRTYRRISILRGKLIAAEQDESDSDNLVGVEQRYAIIIPPGTRGLSNQSAIHVVAVDDSVCVSPRGEQYTVLHLTMASPQDSCSHDECDETLSLAVQYLIKSQTQTTSVSECNHVSFSFASDSPNESTCDTEISGVHVAYRDTQSITCDSAFREAKRIFEKICPGADFLDLSKKVEDEIVYRNEDDSDDERNVLESAVTMINSSSDIPLSTVADNNDKKEDVPDNQAQT